VASPNNDKYIDAISLGWQNIILRNHQEVAEFGKIEYDASSGVFHVELLKDRYAIDTSNKEIVQQPQGTPARTVYSILILHYLVNVKEIDIVGELVSLKSMSLKGGGGRAYYQAFLSRAIQPLVKKFGRNPKDLIRAGEKFGAKVLDKGDASIELSVFPKLPITIIVHEGEEGIPAGANILYDRTAGDHMPLEDLAVIGEIVAYKLVNANV
jgi:hypothetical protein